MAQWRNLAIWSAIGAIVCALAMLAVASLGKGAVAGLLFRSELVAAEVSIVWILASAIIGLGQRNVPVSLANVRAFLISYAVVVATILLVEWSFGALIGEATLGAMAVSEKIAAATGALFLAVSVMVANVSAGTRRMDARQVADMRLHRRQLIYSAASVAAWGEALIVLALTGPGGVLGPKRALAAVLALYAATALLCLFQWRSMDDLQRRLSQQRGNWTFLLMLAIGGGWALLAHVGIAAGPAPLDWLTMVSGLMLVTSIVVAGRRGLLTPA